MSAAKSKKPKAATVLTDDVVLRFIAGLRAKAEDGKVTAGGALRAFRAAGKSCSQERFRQLMKKNGRAS